MSSRLDTAVSVAIGIAAVVIAASVARNSFFPPRSATPAGVFEAMPKASPEDWSEALALGHRYFGANAAPVKVVEFVDLECPACRRFHASLREALAAVDSTQIQVVLVHFPLPNHRFALPSARALECAAETGAVARFVDAVYSMQDSLGLVGWGAFARQAGISDTVRIRDCAQRPDAVSRIESSIALGNRMGVLGTPTVFVNGVPLGAPSREALEEAFAANGAGGRSGR